MAIKLSRVKIKTSDQMNGHYFQPSGQVRKIEEKQMVMGAARTSPLSGI
jgi:hypothetical protein